MNSGTARTAEPISTLNMSKDVFLHKVVPFGGLEKKIMFSPLKPQKPQFWGTRNAFPMGMKNLINFWTVIPIMTKFDNYVASAPNPQHVRSRK